MSKRQRKGERKRRGGGLKREQPDTLHCQTDRSPGKQYHTQKQPDKHTTTHSQYNMHVYTALYIHSYVPTDEADKHKQSR